MTQLDQLYVYTEGVYTEWVHAEGAHSGRLRASGALGVMAVQPAATVSSL